MIFEWWKIASKSRWHQAGVTAITEILGGLTAPFAVEFVELPKREFTKAVDLWCLGGIRNGDEKWWFYYEQWWFSHEKIAIYSWFIC